MNGVPEELASAIERAAATVPRHGGDLDAVLRRHRARRQRRAWAATATTAALVALTAGAAPILTDTSGPPSPTPAASETQPATVAAQRLILAFPTPGGVMAKDQSGVAEVLLDGSVISHPVPGLERGYEARGLPDGPLVTLTGVGVRTPVLRVLRADGTVQYSHVLPAFPALSSLVGATESEAYLLTSSGLVALDLATGNERTVLTAATVGAGLQAKMDSAMDLAGGRFAMAFPPGKACQLQIFDVPAGRKLPSPALGEPDCRQILGVRLSTGGRRLAVAYLQVTDADTVRVAVVDADTGRVRLDSPLPKRSQKRPFDVAGMAWTDSATLRVAWVGMPMTAIPRSPGVTNPLHEQLQITTIAS